MVEYCPKCNAQLPPGLQKCPVCGHRFPKTHPDEYTLRDIFWLSTVVLGIVLLPLLVIIGIVWLIFLK
ncbi:MAG: hypothetical protein A2032_02880 [Chloroflexi bacterium RBG_19FT_COMBO_49_13]|nr:MAG: hypothetical protein A2032_02880 [Chloroflexi bacterium RBG_19FT_COMBO_49_13]